MLNICHEKVITLYVEKKLSTAAIGKIVGCSYTTVVNILQKNGVRLRTASEAQKIRFANSLFKQLKRCPETKKKLIEAYCEQEKTLVECGELIGVSGSLIGKLFSAWGIDISVYERRGGQVKIDTLPVKQVIHDYVEEEMSLVETGQKYGVSATMICTLLERHGIERRTLSEARAAAWRKWHKQRERTETLVAREDTPVGTLAEQVQFLRKERNMLVQDIVAFLKVDAADVYSVLM